MFVTIPWNDKLIASINYGDDGHKCNVRGRNQLWIAGRGSAVRKICRAQYTGSPDPGKAPYTQQSSTHQQYSWEVNNDKDPPKKHPLRTIYTNAECQAGPVNTHPLLYLSVCPHFSNARSDNSRTIFIWVYDSTVPPWEEFQNSSSDLTW